MIAPTPVADDRGGLDYLGPEFLTWLWWRAEAEPRFVHADGTELFVHVDEHLEFRGERAAARRTVLRAGAPGASMDARAALRSGKHLVRARLLFARGEEEVLFTLRAEDLEASAIRLPAPSEARSGGPRDRLEHGLEALERFWADLDLCFARFLEVRTSDQWDAERRRVTSWAAGPSPDEREAAALR